MTSCQGRCEQEMNCLWLIFFPVAEAFCLFGSRMKMPWKFDGIISSPKICSVPDKTAFLQIAFPLGKTVSLAKSVGLVLRFGCSCSRS